jgi:hypothetical protein
MAPIAVRDDIPHGFHSAGYCFGRVRTGSAGPMRS